MRAIILSILLTACATPKKPLDLPSRLPEKEDLSVVTPMARELLARLKSYNVDSGYVITRTESGEIEHKGDAVLWTGLAMAAVPCEDAEPLFTQVSLDTLRRGGMIGRWAASPNNERPSSRDQVRGVMIGFTDLAKRCGKEDIAKETWRLHAQYVADNAGGLFPGANPGYQVTEFFLWPWSMVGEFFEIQPHQGSKTVFEAGLATTAQVIVLQKSAAYPIHLATLDIILADRLGSPISELGFKAFCAASVGSDLGLTEWLCKRKTAKEILLAWAPNTYEYKWQRAPWEGPDAGDHKTPGVDFLLLFHLGGGQY